MRIIIEDSQSFEQVPSSSPFDPIALEDGGPAPAPLLSLLQAGAPARLVSGQEGELQDAGPPPAWLVEAIEQAIQIQGEPGRFEIAPDSSSAGIPGLEAADGGSAPDLNRP